MLFKISRAPYALAQNMADFRNVATLFFYPLYEQLTFSAI